MLGSGTIADPYIIETLHDLQNMNLDLTAHYELGNDIDGAETATWNDNGDDTYAGFIPVGNTTTKFTGTFNGNGHTISNLYVNQPTGSSGDEAGLFGYINTPYEQSPGTIIQNVTLKNFDVTGGCPGALCGKLYSSNNDVNNATTVKNVLVDGCKISHNDIYYYAGGLAGIIVSNNGVCYIFLENVHVKNTEVNHKGSVGAFAGFLNFGFKEMKYCSSVNNTITGGQLGGFFGKCLINGGETNIHDCYAERNSLTGTRSNEPTGGFAGYWYSSDYRTYPCLISDCYVSNTAFLYDSSFDGDFEGGFIGELNNAQTEISNCYTVFTPSGHKTANGFIGNYTNVYSIQNCYWDAEVSGIDTDAAPSGTTGLTTAQMKDPANYTGWDFTTVWANDGVINEGYNFLLYFAPPVTMPFSYWNGSEWVPVSEIKYWNGSEWVSVNSIKRWDGVNWVEG